MIYTTDQILINGTNKLYNGYIYNLDYSPSFGQNPSYATLNVVSEDNTYSITKEDLQIFTPDTINIGTGLSLQMYPVEYEEKKAGNGRVLEIIYIDTSIILDKKIVVLNGRQGNDGTVNKPINPLPTTGTGIQGNASSFVYPNDKFQGSCYIPLGQQLLRESDEINQVLEVYYTFPQLCDGIAYNGIKIAADSLDLIKNSSQYFYARYVGSLRNVLAQWCNDLGYGFYWEDNQLHFIDLTTQLILDTSELDGAIKESTSTRVSIQDTVGRLAVGFYGQDKSETIVTNTDNNTINFSVVSLGAVLHLSDDVINSIKAAYYGYNFFFAYHFLLNNAYGNNMLGILQTIEKTDSSSVNILATALEEKDVNSTNLYNAYWYTKTYTFDFVSQNFFRYWGLANQVGKYYYKPMSYGDYRQITKSQYNINFYTSNTQVSQTSLGSLAANIGANPTARLDQFLLGTDFTVAGIGIQGVIPDLKIEPGDEQLGYGIITLDDQPWYLNNAPVSQNTLQLSINDIYQYLPEKLPLGEGDITKAMSLTSNSSDYNSVIATTIPQVRWEMVSAKNFQGYSKYTFNIVPPDILNPQLANRVTISSIYTDTIPKIEEFIRSEIDKSGKKVNCQSNVIKTEMNYHQFDNSDLTVIGNPLFYLGEGVVYNGIQLVLPAAPNPDNLDEAMQKLVTNLTFSKVDPTITKTYSLPYIDIPNNYLPKLGKGLISLSIRIDEKGVSSTYQFGTRLMQIPSIEVIRNNLSFANKTNQSRFLPYGYGSYNI